MSETRLYRIICRKRSTKIVWGDSDVVYWMPNRAGYTSIRTEAGLYTALDLDDCAGNGYDWLAERLSYNEMRELQRI